MKEATAYCEQEILDVQSDYDNRHFAGGLRIFGFTADLHDKLTMGGGITSEAGSAIVTGLNLPKYRN